jgi:hypothetical protein
MDMTHQSPIPPSKDLVARAFERLFLLLTGHPRSIDSFSRRLFVLFALALVALAVFRFWYDSTNHFGIQAWDELILLGMALLFAKGALRVGRAGRPKP